MAVSDNYLDNIFEKEALEKKKYYGDRTWHYDIDDCFGSTATFKKASGECKVIDVRYDKSIDCYVFYIEDVDTHETFSGINEFGIDLSFM